MYCWLLCLFTQSFAFLILFYLMCFLVLVVQLYLVVSNISYVVYNCSSLLGIICIRILLFIGVLLAIMGRIPICPSFTSLPLNFYVISI